MDKLSDRVMALEGPDREVDAEIADAMGLGPPNDWLRKPQRGADGSWNMNAGDWISPCHTRLRKSLPYTASLDAAMSLVPEGWECFDVDATAPELGVDWTLHHGKESVKGTAANPAIALCAAALKARGL